MGRIARQPHAFSARCSVRAVRAVVPRGVPLGARITGSDWADGGLTPDDAVTLGKALKDVGLDYIDVSSGGATAEIRTPTSPGYNAPIAERLRGETGIVVRTVGMTNGRATRRTAIPKLAGRFVGKWMLASGRKKPREV